MYRWPYLMGFKARLWNILLGFRNNLHGEAFMIEKNCEASEMYVYFEASQKLNNRFMSTYPIHTLNRSIAVSILCTRVKANNDVEWKKLKIRLDFYVSLKMQSIWNIHITWYKISAKPFCNSTVQLECYLFRHLRFKSKFKK